MIPLLLIPAYAFNPLQDTNLKGQSAIVPLDIEFGQDEIKVMRTKTIVEPTLDSLTMTLYGDVIDLSDSRLKVYANGKLFSILNTELGILMYGRYQEETDNYAVNVYLATNEGLKKQVAITAVEVPDDKVVKTEPKEEKLQYIPDLMMTSSHDFRTYWKDTFNIEVQAFNGRINSDPKSSDFNGRLDGVDVKVLLSLDEVLVASLSGVTANNGHWEGEHFFDQNISAPGEYTVDVILTHLGETVSKSSTMFVIGTVLDNNGSGNQAPLDDEEKGDAEDPDECDDCGGSRDD